MSKKHFILFAETIKNKFCLDKPWAEIPVATRRAALDAVEIVEQVALDSNPRFDSRRFRAACGVFA